ncbi:MAG: sialate O-acetylesterase [Chitinophagaceae bacterium]
MNLKMTKKLIVLVLLFCIVETKAAVKLPKIFTSNMVLQRDKPIKIWGWADKDENVTVSFNGQSVQSKADKSGNWIITLKPMAFGGPYQMKVAGKKNAIDLKNILIGDVWICSGQSNMEWIIKNTNSAEKEIAESKHPRIRLFTVEKAMAYQPEKDIEGGEWLECGPQTVGDFSAVAYFFGRKLNKDMNIPIGLINSSWGGTNVQTWISWDLMSKKPGYEKVNYQDLEKEMAQRKLKQQQFRESLANDIGKIEKWFEPGSATTGWKKIQLPGAWESTEIGNADGVIWFKKDFYLPQAIEGKKVALSLGPIDDADETYLNGKLIGSTHEWNADRQYTVDGALLKSGKNTIVIKVTDTGGGGGLYGTEEQLYVDVNGNKIELAGEWNYKTAVVTTDFGIKDDGPNSFPSQLYNAMIAPIIQYPVKGGIWYQGEANAWEAYNYRTLFADMIKDWRAKWGYEFPFFWVQLANFMKPDTMPKSSDWAELREAQGMTLNLPQTGQAVTIDIGEADDIHPRNKQDVGYRLALAAEKIAYGKDIVHSGPVFESMKKEKGKIILTFTSTGTGLMAKDKYGYLKGFTVAGSDQKFAWAKAMIEGNKVIVFNETIADPVSVRYAWANNPDEANLYNKEGLPASPFRTDTWKGITEK